MRHSTEQLEQFAIVDPAVYEWLSKQPPPEGQGGDIFTSFRALMQACDDKILSTFPEEEDGIDEADIEISLRDNTQSLIRVWRPVKTPSGGSPLFVWIYGGGWLGGSRIQALPRARQLVKLFGAVVCAPSYRLCPEYVFPTQWLDVYDSLKWIASNAEHIGADPKLGFIVGGVSAGANMAATSVRRAQVEEPLAHPITGQWLECLFMFPDDDMVPKQYQQLFLSRLQCTDVPFVTTSEMRVTPGLLEWDAKSPLVSCVNYPDSYGGMPPAYFSIDGADPMRDDGLIYDEMLKADGVKTRVDVYAGQPHAHILFMPDYAVSRKALVDGFSGAAWLLGKAVTAEHIAAAEPVMKT